MSVPKNVPIKTRPKNMVPIVIDSTLIAIESKGERDLVRPVASLTKTLFDFSIKI